MWMRKLIDRMIALEAGEAPGRARVTIPLRSAA